MLWGGGIFIGEGYIRRPSPPHFPSETHGAVPPSPPESPVRPVRGGRRRASGCGKVFPYPAPNGP